MAMTWNDMVDLLSLAAVFDQRTVGEEDVKGWLLIAELERWTAPAARRVLIEHYRAGADRPRITAPAISDGIRAARRRAGDSFRVPDVPDGLPGKDYPAWYRAQLTAHIDRQLDEWAAGAEMPVAPLERGGPLPIEAAPPELQDQIRRDIDRIGSLRRPDRHLSQRLRGERDPEERRKARAELAELHQRITQETALKAVAIAAGELR